MQTLTKTETSARPFLKWVGGKTKLLSQIAPMVPRLTGRYFEPFIGGGAMFFHLGPEQAILSDVNAELINTYRAIRDDVEGLIDDLRTHEHSAEYYQEIRALDRLKNFNTLSDIKKASRFIYLNKTCFNGLYRVNKRGQFNTPRGDHKNPNWCDGANLRAVSERLQGVELVCASFKKLAEFVDCLTSDDFVYFDPPYVPIEQDSFTSYTADGFDMDDQQSLAELCKSLDSIGIKFMLSNSSAPVVKELYKGFSIHEVYAPRSINSKGSGRAAIPEFLIKNYL